MEEIFLLIQHYPLYALAVAFLSLKSNQYNMFYLQEKEYKHRT